MHNRTLIFERNGPVAKLTLNRPSAGNAIDLAMAEALKEAAIVCDLDDSIHCVILTGADRVFCRGRDAPELQRVGATLPDRQNRLSGHLYSAVQRLAWMEKPLVTSINGAALGAGLSLALLGDIAIAGRSAEFGLTSSEVDLSPDAGTSWLLPRLIGVRRAQQLMLLNKRIEANEAETLGLLTYVVEDADLAAETDSIATELLRSSNRAVGKIRQLISSGLSTTLKQQLQLEARALEVLARSI